MTAAFGAIGTGANGSTTVAPSYPTGITRGQLLTCHVTSGATNSEVPTTPAGWILLATGASTDGTFGIDTGPRRSTVFARVADGSESGTLTVSITNGNTCRGTIARWTSSIGSGWVLQAIGGDDSTSGTDFSAAVGSINWAVGDCALVVVGQRVDTVTQSAQSLTASGTTFGARTNQASTAVTTGNDHRHVVDTFAAVTTGGGSATTTWAYTGSAATSGGVVVVRIREIGDVAESIGFSAAQTSTLIFAPERTNEALVGSPAHGSMTMRRAALAESVNQTYNRQRDEALTLTDAASEASTLPRARAETIGFTDAGAEASTLNAARAESVSLSAAQTGTTNAVTSKQRDESIGLSDAQSEVGTFPRAAAETLTLSDSQYVVTDRMVNEALVGSPLAGVARWVRAEGPGVKQRDELLTLSATQIETAAFARTAAESFSLTAAQTQRGFNVAASETLGLSASQAETGAIGVARAETLSLSESSVRSLGAIKVTAESLAFTDAATGTRLFSASRAETIGFTDSVAKAFTAAAPRFNQVLIGERRESLFQPWAMDAIVSLQRDEVITFTDAQAESTTKPATRGETLSLSDGQVETGTFAKARAESISLTSGESGVKGVLYVVQRAEAIAFADSSARTSSLNATVAQTIGLSPAQTESTSLQSAAAEGLTFTDSAAGSLKPIYSVTRAETLSLSAVQVSSLNHPILVAQQQEGLSLFGSQTQVPTLNASKTELLLLNDAIDVVSGFNRFLSEAIGFGEASYVVTGPFSDRYRYDVPASSLRYEVPGLSLRFDVPSIDRGINIGEGS